MFSVAMKAFIFRARKRGRCGRIIESIFTDVKTCVIFNDYRALAFKFEDRRYMKKKIGNEVSLV